MSTLGDPGDNHLREVFQAYRALHVARIDHVKDYLHDISPFYGFIRVIEVQHIVVLCVGSRADNEFES